jgi:hypothetical protein
VRRWSLLLLAAALVSASCSASGEATRDDLGADMPVCDRTGNSLILSVQAVSRTEFVPCVQALRAGWKYVQLQARRGESVFWLDSDRLGTRFLQVELLPSCNTSGAVEVESDEVVPLFVDVEVQATVPVTIVPDSSNSADYAAGIQAELEQLTISDRPLTVEVDTTDATTAQRLATAQALGHAVLIVSARDAEDGTATLILPGDDKEQGGMSGDEILSALERVTDPASYTGRWYYEFPTACIVYTFDAHGSGVDTIEADVKAALGLFDAEALRQQARQEGYEV